MQEHLALYAQEPVANNRRATRRLTVYVGLSVLLAAASLVAVNGRGGAAPRFPRVLMPGSSPTCTSPPNGFLFSQTVDGSTFQVCISQQGNINQISYPDTAPGHTQIAWDGYCLKEFGGPKYQDYSPGSGVASFGFGPATLTQTAPNTLSMTRNTSDGKLQLTQFIKINFQPRSVFVGMTVKNIDPANVTHEVHPFREVAPAIDGDAADDEYNQFGGDGTGGGTGTDGPRTGQAFQSLPLGSNSLLFGPTQASALVLRTPVAWFQDGGGCANYDVDAPGYVAGGNRVYVGFINSGRRFFIAPNATVNVGKFVYRMV